MLSTVVRGGGETYSWQISAAFLSNSGSEGLSQYFTR
jgi:hypothetical protein